MCRVVEIDSLVANREERVSQLYKEMMVEYASMLRGREGANLVKMDYREVMLRVDRLFRRDTKDKRLIRILAECMYMEGYILNIIERYKGTKGVDELEKLIYTLKDDLEILDDMVVAGSGVQFFDVVVVHMKAKVRRFYTENSLEEEKRKFEDVQK